MRSSLLICAAGCVAAGIADAREDLGAYFDTFAEQVCIMDAETGIVLYSKNGDQPMIPASMTKIMTAFVVFEHIESGRIALDREFRVSREAYRRGGSASGGSTSFLEPDSRVSVEDLLRGMIVQSGNDAAIALAEGISGSEEAFARAMTRRARELGLRTANFTNTSGLNDPEHRIGAVDLARLTRILIQRFPEFYKMFGERVFTWNGIKQRNRNPLLGNFPGADGVKTGHLRASGYGIVASASQSGTRRIVVINGLHDAERRKGEIERVMRAAMDEFKVRDLVRVGGQIGEAEVYLGIERHVPLVAERTATAGLHVDAIRKMSAEIVYNGPLIAPITAGQPVGELIIRAPGIDRITVPVMAGSDVRRLNLLARAILGLTGVR